MGTRVTATGGRRTPAIDELDRSQARSSTNHRSSSSSSKTSYRHHHHREHRERKIREHSESTTNKHNWPRAERQNVKKETGEEDSNTKIQATASSDSIPKAHLDRLAKDILDQTKQLGFFDEVRMVLLDRVESSREFQKVKDEFSREVERFCSQADLALPRSKLRDQLQVETFGNEGSKLSCRLRESIDRITYKYMEEKLRPLYNEHAIKFLLQEKQYVIIEPSLNLAKHIDGQRERPTSSKVPHLSQEDYHECGGLSVANIAGTSSIGQEPDQEQLSLSCSSSQADSGFSITPPASCRRRKESTSISPPKSSESQCQMLDEGDDDDDDDDVATATMAAIMMSGSLQFGEGDQEELAFEPKGKLAVRYARRRERRIKKKDNWRRFKAHKLQNSSSFCPS